MASDIQSSQIALAQLGGTDCGPVVAALQSQGWNVSVVSSVEELNVLAQLGTYHVAIVAAASSSDLPLASVRTLLGLQSDMSVLFLVANRDEARLWPALRSASWEQIWDLHGQADKLIAVIREELVWILSAQPQYKVLCVDDDEDFLNSLENLLTFRLRDALPRVGLEFEMYSSSSEALQAAPLMPPESLSLIICDQMMPDIKGIDLLRRLKPMYPDTPCVLLTGYAGLDSTILAINERIVDSYLTKPIEHPLDFINVIRQLIRSFHLRRASGSQRFWLSSQFEFMRAISATQSAGLALQTSLDFLQEQIRSQMAMLMLKQDDSLVSYAAIGTDGVRDGVKLSASSGLGAWILTQHLPVLLAAADDHDELISQHIPSPAMAMPLRLAGEDIGVILAGGLASLNSVGPGVLQHFTRNDRIVMSFVAEVLSLTVGRLRDRNALEAGYVEMMASFMETLEAKDSYTRGHTDRVRLLALTLAESAGMSPTDRKDLEWAASLHDIGKIAVPDDIINKPSRLSAKEYSIVKEHPARGDRILQHLRFLDGARKIVRSHHEQFDGKGYPDGLAGTDIPLGARILSIADAYDAMTSTRSYRQALGPLEALAEIEVGSGKQFDPELVKLFLEITRKSISPSPMPIPVLPAEIVA
jgi:putative nucleotidyltransferase with HDIG domain